MVSAPADASRYLGTWLDLATSHRQTWLFSSTSMYHSTDLLTVRGVAHLVVHETSGSTSYETIPHVQLEISGDVLSTADMVVQRRDGPRRLREIDDDDIASLRLDAADILGLSSCTWRQVTAVIACMHLKHNSCHVWPTPHQSVICVELLGHSRQPMTGRLAAHPSNTAVKIYILTNFNIHKLYRKTFLHH